MIARLKSEQKAGVANAGVAYVADSALVIDELFRAVLQPYSALILVFGWNPVLVIAGSLLLTFVLLVGLAGIFEDIALLAKQACRFVLLYLKGLGREAARLSVVAAGMIRLAFRRAHELYIRHIRTPLRRRTERVVEVAANFDTQAKEHLKAENEKHRSRFHAPVNEPEPKAAETGVVAP